MDILTKLIKDLKVDRLADVIRITAIQKSLDDYDNRMMKVEVVVIESKDGMRKVRLVADENLEFWVPTTALMS